ncbi:deoxyribodipyrimidine photo-lyase [Sulfitobacter sp. LCG007]
MTAPAIVWFRRDLRLSDHRALDAACRRGGPVIPVFIRDDTVTSLGIAPQWRLGLGLAHFAESLSERNSRLILRSGDATEVLRDLIAETGATAVYWSRLYDPASIARDTAVKDALKEDGIEAESFDGHLMFEPWTVETGQGGYYKVYTPFWRAVKDREVATPLRTPPKFPAPDSWPCAETLEDWRLGKGMRRGADVVRPYVRLGEQAAQGRLGAFMAHAIEDYTDARDRPAEDGTSGLSENLSLGEISPAQCWHAGIRAREEGKKGAETWLKELVWREFAYHLMYHTPHILDANWRPEWKSFPWRDDRRLKEVRAWERGRTGIEFVDAAMRELYVTGRMHNRARMIVASYLCKHLMVHWRVGQAWFDNHLIDWDPASNALGWQWTAGSGPDASPYFRVFNPDTQREKFDPRGAYLDRWIAEGREAPSDTALSYFDAIPEGWGLSPEDSYPEPVVGLGEGRSAALEAYENRNF